MQSADALHSNASTETHALVQRWLPRALWLCTLAQVLAGLTLAWMNQLSFARVFAEYMAASTLAALTFSSGGLLILTRRAGQPIGWLMCAIGLLAGLGVWSGQYARYAYVTQPGALPLREWAAWLYMSVSFGPFIGLTLIVLPLLFPTGHLPSSRWQPFAWLAGLAITLFSLVQAVSPGPIDASLPEVANPFGQPALVPLLGVLGPASVVLMLASFAGAIAAPVLRFRRVAGDERQQIKWFAYAIALLIAATVVPAALVYPDFSSDSMLSGVALALAYSFLPVALGIAILRYRLYDIDVLINRTLVYGVLTASVFGLYVVVVGYLGALFHAQGDVRVALLATGLVAVLFQPLRVRVQRAVNQLMYGQRDDPYGVLARFGHQLESALTPNLVLPAVARTIGETLKLPYVAIALGSGDDQQVVAEYRGARGAADELHWALTHQGRAVGELRLAPRPGESALSAADQRLVGDLARQAGMAAHAVLLHQQTLQLADDLQQARERLVLAREEERRRLRRDLHDGLGPTLAGLTLKIDAAHDELYHDRDEAAGMLRGLKGDVREAIADIRRLVYGLRPPALDELGLLAALQMQVAQFAQPALQITLDAPAALPALPAALEVAAYRIVAEALTNVARHAGARNCRVRVAAGSALEIEVTDDGAGLPAELRHGVGLGSMRERTAELGGSCTIEPAPGGGTRVLARLPMPAHENDLPSAQGE